ncbi:hypothetical protein [Biostraticola tofi]|uniref:Surface presentation of antigen gene type M protein n=1 Tax=Biostraticola tofi TaxID=466109 RepID=A0A4R3YW09_9GAMM|nr:hypothetical protein [Biostraticola tofi]TCV96666.1 surface presentation of antigen gene type M protein [Biostraticola tofi]
MALLMHVKRLIERCDFRQQRCESTLKALSASRTLLEDEIQALGRQREGMLELIHHERPQGALLRSQLFMAHRRLAVLRASIKSLQLEETQLKEKLIELDQQQRLIHESRHHWVRKAAKYQSWLSKKRRSRLMTGLRLEELDTEELSVWK